MMIAIVVVLPAPLPPSSAVIDPRGRANEMPATAVPVLYFFTRSWTSIACSAGMLDSDLAETCGAGTNTKASAYFLLLAATARHAGQ
jgi:hypothetical protein